jgi:hypothetical protein
MPTPVEFGDALARSTREKVLRAAQEVGRRDVDVLECLAHAWPYLRPLFPRAVPGQAGLTDAQRTQLQSVLDRVGGPCGAGANGPVVRRLSRWEALKVADDIRRLAASIQTSARQSAEDPVLGVRS